MLMMPRKKAGISVRQLQKIMGFTNPQAIYKWQNGKCLPSIDNLVALASILGVTIDELLIYGDDDAGSIADRLFALFRCSLYSISIFTTRTCWEIL